MQSWTFYFWLLSFLRATSFWSGVVLWVQTTDRIDGEDESDNNSL